VTSRTQNGPVPYLPAEQVQGIKIWFVAPPAVAMRDDLKAHLDEHHIPWVETEDLESVLRKSTWST